MEEGNQVSPQNSTTKLKFKKWSFWTVFLALLPVIWRTIALWRKDLISPEFLKEIFHLEILLLSLAIGLNTLGISLPYYLEKGWAGKGIFFPLFLLVVCALNLYFYGDSVPLSSLTNREVSLNIVGFLAGLVLSAFCIYFMEENEPRIS